MPVSKRNDPKPRPKVVAASAGSVVGAGIISIIESLAKTDLLLPVEAMIILLCTFALGYAMPDRSNYS